MRHPVARHVFVDDSGRRGRRTRLVGMALALLVGGYVVVVAVAFSGVAGSEGLGVPGLGDLASPSDQQSAEVGANPVESPAPTPPAAAAEEQTPGAGATPASAPPAVPPPTTTVEPPPPTVLATTTTTRPGNSSATPNSTVPGHGPPTSRPKP